MAQLIKDPAITHRGEGFTVYVVLDSGYVLGAHQGESVEMRADIIRAAEALGKRVKRQDECIG